jgi:DNA-binding transcriptional ArsR family regulator
MTVPAHDGVPYDTDIAQAAALMADPTRAAMLRALLSDRPLAAGELARLAGVSAATASFHLAKLLDGNMIAVARQGRHRYYRLAGHEVAAALEAIGLISAALPVRTLRQSREAAALAEARTCYDHLAGRAGVGLLDALLGQDLLAREQSKSLVRTDRGNSASTRFVVTGAGARTLVSFGIDMTEVRGERRRFAGECVDWTQRRGHLNGALAAAITARLFEVGWIARVSLAPSSPAPPQCAHHRGGRAGPSRHVRTRPCAGSVSPGTTPGFWVGGQRGGPVVGTLLGQVVPVKLAAAARDDGRPHGGVLLEILDSVRIERVLDHARDHDVSLSAGQLRR